MEKALSISLQSINKFAVLHLVIFQDASMLLHKWHTDSRQMHELWIKNDIVNEDLKPSEENNLSNKVLG